MQAQRMWLMCSVDYSTGRDDSNTASAWLGQLWKNAYVGYQEEFMLVRSMLPPWKSVSGVSLAARLPKDRHRLPRSTQDYLRRKLSFSSLICPRLWKSCSRPSQVWRNMWWLAIEGGGGGYTLSNCTWPPADAVQGATGPLKMTESCTSYRQMKTQSSPTCLSMFLFQKIHSFTAKYGELLLGAVFSAHDLFPPMALWLHDEYQWDNWRRMTRQSLSRVHVGGVWQQVRQHAESPEWIVAAAVMNATVMKDMAMVTKDMMNVRDKMDVLEVKKEADVQNMTTSKYVETVADERLFEQVYLQYTSEYLKGPLYWHPDKLQGWLPDYPGTPMIKEGKYTSHVIGNLKAFSSNELAFLSMLFFGVGLYGNLQFNFYDPQWAKVDAGGFFNVSYIVESFLLPISFFMHIACYIQRQNGK
ncbi:ML2 [Symbiodinium sp. CCMP2456]|nr:ML2 [Symbiodinium sp. CCMP2456]